MDGHLSETQSIPQLFEYGIHTEGSDIRAHVAPLVRSIYVFRTREMIDWIENNKGLLQKKKGYQQDVDHATADGWLVPIEHPDILAMVRRLSFHSYQGWKSFPERDASTSQKGDAAVDVVVALLQRGRFPLWIEAAEDDRLAVQIKGIDIVVFAKKKIQVKCDYWAGPKDVTGCTGNLYLQTHERNTRNLY